MWVWSNDPSIWGATDPLSPHKSAPATYQNQRKEVHFCGHWALWPTRDYTWVGKLEGTRVFTWV